MRPSDGAGRANDRLESDSTLHLSVSPSWGGAGQFGAEAALLDRLSVGPVDESIFAQSQIRRRYWAGIDKRLERWSGRALTRLKPNRGARSRMAKQFIRVQWASGLRRVLARAPRPKHLILWTSRAWQDRVIEWCLLSVLSQLKVDPERMSIVEPYRADYGTREGLACYPVDDLKRARQQVPPGFVREHRCGRSLRPPRQWRSTRHWATEAAGLEGCRRLRGGIASGSRGDSPGRSACGSHRWMNSCWGALTRRSGAHRWPSSNGMNFTTRSCLFRETSCASTVCCSGWITTMRNRCSSFDASRDRTRSCRCHFG